MYVCMYIHTYRQYMTPASRLETDTIPPMSAVDLAIAISIRLLISWRPNSPSSGLRSGSRFAAPYPRVASPSAVRSMHMSEVQRNSQTVSRHWL